MRSLIDQEPRTLKISNSVYNFFLLSRIRYCIWNSLTLAQNGVLLELADLIALIPWPSSLMEGKETVPFS